MIRAFLHSSNRGGNVLKRTLSFFKTNNLFLKLLMFLLVVSPVSCETSPKGYSKAPNKSLVKGVKKHGVDVKIRAVNKSGILHTHKYKLGNSVWLPPGKHEIILECTWQGKTKWEIRHHKISLLIEKEKTYTITAFQKEGHLQVDVQQTN